MDIKEGKMKKLLLIVLFIPLLAGCMSLVPTAVKEDYARVWASDNGYIPAEDCPDVCEDLPERQPLPKPIVPLFETEDAQGDPIPITERYLMDIIIKLFGTVEKFQYLVEIYEREYLNSDGRIMPDLSLDELKALYEGRLSVIERARLEQPESEAPEGIEGTTSSATLGDDLTVEQFEELLGVWKEINATNPDTQETTIDRVFK